MHSRSVLYVKLDTITHTVYVAVVDVDGSVSSLLAIIARTNIVVATSSTHSATRITDRGPRRLGQTSAARRGRDQVVTLSPCKNG